MLKDLKSKYNDRIILSFQKNVGWKQSFLELVHSSENEYDYYGFSDQDDIWFEKKLINCIQLAEKDTYSGPKLIHCNSLSVTSALEERSEQETRIANPPTFKAAIATEYFQGCGMVWNNEAMRLIQRHKPHNKNLAHDYWAGLICYLFGKVYFCDEPQFYHIRYDNNSSDDGNKNKGRVKRLKTLFLGGVAYMNPAKDLIDGYNDLLSDEEKVFLQYIVHYKEKLSYKVKLFTDKAFRKPSISATALLKVAILMNKY